MIIMGEALAPLLSNPISILSIFSSITHTDYY
jgi:hypothetical protein